MRWTDLSVMLGLKIKPVYKQVQLLLGLEGIFILWFRETTNSLLQKKDFRGFTDLLIREGENCEHDLTLSMSV